MKKFSWIFALILALSMAFVFAGCGEEPSNPGVYDGSGPKVLFLLSDWIATGLSAGEVRPGDLQASDYKISGNPTLTKTLDGALEVTGTRQDYDGFTIEKAVFDGLPYDYPYEVTFSGYMIKTGKLKISKSESNWGTIKDNNPTVAAGDDFEIVATVTADHISSQTTGNYPGVRIQSDGAAVDFAITEIKFVKK